MTQPSSTPSVTSPDKQKLLEQMFKTVLDADIHLDNKASRILTVMAFTTAAAAAIYNKAALAPNITRDVLSHALTKHLMSLASPNDVNILTNKVINEYNTNNFQLWGVIDRPLFSFFLYMSFAGLSALFFLLALGPRLHIPRFWKTKTSGSKCNEQLKDIKSALFYDLIAQTPLLDWEKLLTNSNGDELSKHLEKDYILEIHLVACKTKTKYRWMQAGSTCFRIALISLAVLVCSLIVNSDALAGIISFWVIFIFVFAQLLTNHFFASTVQPCANRTPRELRTNQIANVIDEFVLAVALIAALWFLWYLKFVMPY